MSISLILIPAALFMAPAPQRTRIGDAGAIPNSAVVAPQVIQSSPPIYTSEAILRRLEGTVTLEVAVDLEGKQTILRVVKGLGYGLDERAIGAVLSWKLAPALRNGIPVDSVCQIDVDFKLPNDPGIPMGPGMTPPVPITRVTPQYSDEARQKGYQGTVILQAVIKTDGSVEVLRVVRALGMGLDENAISALTQWKFKPGMQRGEAVPVRLNIEVNFNLDRRNAPK